MTNHDQEKKAERKDGMNPVAAVLTGMIVGAGAAVAGAVALKDKKNRKKVKQALANVKNKAAAHIEEMQMRAKDKKQEVEDDIEEGKAKVKKTANSAKNSLERGLKEAEEAAQT